MAKKCIDLCILMIKIPNFLCCKLNRANCMILFLFVSSLMEVVCLLTHLGSSGSGGSGGCPGWSMVCWRLTKTNRDVLHCCGPPHHPRAGFYRGHPHLLVEAARTWETLNSLVIPVAHETSR